ncbi:unnamed protein product [Closterium sp. Yama58-4]|nr:unnamed protein product [Closterium sp. Yama58-4]
MTTRVFVRGDRLDARWRWMRLLQQLPDARFYDYLRVDRRVYVYLVRHYELRGFGRPNQPDGNFVKVALALTRMGHGWSYRELGLHFGFSVSYAKKVYDIFIVFVTTWLVPKWVKWPTPDDLGHMAAEFRMRGGIPGVVGAIDGTYIRTRGWGIHREDFRNRKGFFSIILQIICDSAGYIWDFFAGWPGSVNDARVFNNSPAHARIEAGDLHDYVIVSDAAYGLHSYTYTPFRATPGRPLPSAMHVWNLQQSRTRMVVEQVFGRLKGKWRVLDGRMESHIGRVVATVSAAVVIHNIELVLGERPRLGVPRERNLWWLAGPVAKRTALPPLHARLHSESRLAGYFYASWRLGHPSLSRPILGLATLAMHPIVTRIRIPLSHRRRPRPADDATATDRNTRRRGGSN